MDYSELTDFLPQAINSFYELDVLFDKILLIFLIHFFVSNDEETRLISYSKNILLKHI